MAINRMIIVQKIAVRKPGQIVHFQIKLPPDTKKVTGVKISTMRTMFRVPEP